MGGRGSGENRPQDGAGRAQNPASEGSVFLQRLRPVHAEGRGDVPLEQREPGLVVRQEIRRDGRLRSRQLRGRNRAPHIADRGAQTGEGQGDTEGEEDENGEAEVPRQSQEAGSDQVEKHR